MSLNMVMMMSVLSSYDDNENNNHDDNVNDDDDDNVDDDDDDFVQWTQFSLPHNPGCPRALARTRITQKYSS